MRNIDSQKEILLNIYKITFTEDFRVNNVFSGIFTGEVKRYWTPPNPQK